MVVDIHYTAQSERLPVRRKAQDIIQELARVTTFTPLNVVRDAYLRERIRPFKQEYEAAGKAQQVKGATDLARRLGVEPGTIYKYLRQNLDDCLNVLAIDYVEVLMAGFKPGAEFKLYDARKHFGDMEVPITDECLLALLKDCVTRGLLTTKGKKRLRNATYTATNERIDNNYEFAPKKASIVLSAPDCRAFVHEYLLGPKGIAFMQMCLDSIDD